LAAVAAVVVEIARSVNTLTIMAKLTATPNYKRKNTRAREAQRARGLRAMKKASRNGSRRLLRGAARARSH